MAKHTLPSGPARPTQNSAPARLPSSRPSPCLGPAGEPGNGFQLRPQGAQDPQEEPAGEKTAWGLGPPSRQDLRVTEATDHRAFGSCRALVLLPGVQAHAAPTPPSTPMTCCVTPGCPTGLGIGYPEREAWKQEAGASVSQLCPAARPPRPHVAEGLFRLQTTCWLPEGGRLSLMPRASLGWAQSLRLLQPLPASMPWVAKGSLHL